MEDTLILNQGRILVVDDDSSNLEVLEKVLTKKNYEVKTLSTGTEAIDVINQWQPHLVILDVSMPDLDGIDVVKRIRQKSNYISVIFLSAKTETEDIVLGLDAGADDYLCKPFKIDELLARIRAQLRIKNLQDQLATANARLKELVDIDDLTGLYNMRSLYERLDGELSRCRRFGASLAVIMMDMDRFKEVNDENDHLFGSYVLAEIGKVIRENVRKIDHAARYGGDEFIMILSEVHLNGAIIFCERLRKAIEAREFNNGNHSTNVTCSIGLAIIGGKNHKANAIELVKIADKALYEAKDAGRNCICYYDLADQTQKSAIKVK
ncbi:MAG: diguanylate cyclase [Bdellovibrionales bacterium]|nr:diguanylate cyclase [Bdellovibrionales bacterium]